MKPLEFEALVKLALNKAQSGKPSVELRVLYNAEYRNKVRWLDFPECFRPSNPEDYECHEG